MGIVSVRPVISPQLRLTIFLRMMAGAQVWDCMVVFGVGRSTVFFIFKETKNVVMEVLKFPGLSTSFSMLKRDAL